MPDALALFSPALDTTRGPIRTRWFSPERADRLSPLQRVRPGLLPASLFHGTADVAAPYAEAEAFREATVASGNRCEWVGFEGEGHGFLNFGRDDGAAYWETVGGRRGFWCCWCMSRMFSISPDCIHNGYDMIQRLWARF